MAPTNGSPLRLRIVDSDGRSLAGIRVKSDNGIICHTRADGSIDWTERSLMNRDVQFRIEAPAVRSSVTHRVVPDGHVDVIIGR